MTDCAICDQPITPGQVDAQHSNNGHPCHEDCCPCWYADKLGASRVHVFDSHRTAT